MCKFHKCIYRIGWYLYRKLGVGRYQISWKKQNKTLWDITSSSLVNKCTRRPCSEAGSPWPLSPWWGCQSLPRRALARRLWRPCRAHDTWVLREQLLLSLFCCTRIVMLYQYFLCTWLLLWRLRRCSNTSSLLASRRAPVVSFSKPRQESSRVPFLTFIPSIILERTGSTEEMDVTPESSKRSKQMHLY